MKINNKSKTVSILVFFLVFQIYAQIEDSPTFQDSLAMETNNWQLFKYDIGNVFGGIGYSYTRPLHWQGKQLITLGAITAGTGILYIYDKETSDFARRQKESVPKFIRDYGSEFGSPQYNYMFTGGVYLTGLLTKNEKLRRTGVLLIASASSAGLLQQISKSLVGRARPESGKTKDTFDPFNPDRSYHSFPSGHAMLAFTNAYAIGKQFKNPWIKAGIYTVGLVPGVSRLWDGQHWLTDVALGVAISVFTVESIDRYLDKKYQEKYNNSSKKVDWSINITPGQVGIVGHF